MNRKQLEEKLRRDFPKMFHHPEAQEGEIWIGDRMAEAVKLQIVSYKTAGLSSARHGKPFLSTPRVKKSDSNGPADIDKEEWTYYPLFANLREYIDCEEKHLAKNHK